MSSQRFNPAAMLGGVSHAIFTPRWRIGALVVLLSAVFAASAQAHTVNATATCTSVTFNWTAFSSTGSGNGGLNTPRWTIVFTPTAATAATAARAAATTLSGTASFAGRSYSLTVAIPRGNGAVAASSSWTSAQTRDGNASSWSRSLSIFNCPAVPIVPVTPVTPVTPVAPAALAQPALSTSASGNVAPDAAIHDTAVLSGGSSPTGTMTFNLYSASDTTCSTALSTASVPVSGAGSYDSPAVTPATAGSYQWVATYSGDAHNAGVSGACNDPAEQSTVALTVVKASCVASPVVLRGLSAKVHSRLTIHVTALGLTSVTFYLDGRKLAKVTKARNHRFSVTIDARRLGYGRHRLSATVTTRGASCTRAAAAGAFVRVRSPTIRPHFTG